MGRLKVPSTALPRCCAEQGARPHASLRRFHTVVTGLHLPWGIARCRPFLWAHRGSVGILHLNEKRSCGLGCVLLTHTPPAVA